MCVRISPLAENEAWSELTARGIDSGYAIR